MVKYYTGIGNRKITCSVYKQCVELGKQYAEEGYILRSGGADGCDSAFEEGCDLAGGGKEIYLPWKTKDNPSTFYNINPNAYNLAEKYYLHTWNTLRSPIKKIMARNVQQVLGYDLQTPSDFLICWTADGCNSFETRTRNTGGTGMAIAVATDYANIPLINLNKGDPNEWFETE